MLFERDVMNDIDFTFPKINDNVKITHKYVNSGRERFWVTVSRILDKTVEGIVDNDLVNSSHFKFGDKIIFNFNDILSILPA